MTRDMEEIVLATRREMEECVSDKKETERCQISLPLEQVFPYASPLQ